MAIIARLILSAVCETAETAEAGFQAAPKSFSKPLYHLRLPGDPASVPSSLKLVLD